MAPAFGFQSLWEKELGSQKMAEWRKKGTISVFHYGQGGQMDLSYGLMRDAEIYEDYPEVSAPCLIFHGVRDPVVPVAVSEKFALGRSNVRLVELESGHELTDVLDEIWKESKPFLMNRTYDKASALEVI
jgi:pimeloyl-ACP methyl ester carboxylesterase